MRAIHFLFSGRVCGPRLVSLGFQGTRRDPLHQHPLDQHEDQDDGQGGQHPAGHDPPQLVCPKKVSSSDRLNWIVFARSELVRIKAYW